MLYSCLYLIRSVDAATMPTLDKALDGPVLKYSRIDALRFVAKGFSDRMAGNLEKLDALIDAGDFVLSAEAPPAPASLSELTDKELEGYLVALPEADLDAVLEWYCEEMSSEDSDLEVFYTIRVHAVPLSESGADDQAPQSSTEKTAVNADLMGRLHLISGRVCGYDDDMVLVVEADNEVEATEAFMVELRSFERPDEIMGEEPEVFINSCSPLQSAIQSRVVAP